METLFPQGSLKSPDSLGYVLKRGEDAFFYFPKECQERGRFLPLQCLSGTGSVDKKEAPKWKKETKEHVSETNFGEALICIGNIYFSQPICPKGEIRRTIMIPTFLLRNRSGALRLITLLEKRGGESEFFQTMGSFQEREGQLVFLTVIQRIHLMLEQLHLPHPIHSELILQANNYNIGVQRIHEFSSSEKSGYHMTEVMQVFIDCSWNRQYMGTLRAKTGYGLVDITDYMHTPPSIEGWYESFSRRIHLHINPENKCILERLFKMLHKQVAPQFSFLRLCWRWYVKDPLLCLRYGREQVQLKASTRIKREGSEHLHLGQPKSESDVLETSPRLKRRKSHQ